MGIVISTKPLNGFGKGTGPVTKAYFKMKKRIVGFFLFPQFELLDVFGPAEMFGVIDELPGGEGTLEVIMVGETSGPVPSKQGPRVVAEYGFADAPHLDILLVPGGQGTRAGVKSSVVLEWIRAQAERVEWLTSVCTGSALLAKAGALDGYKATSNKLVFDWVVTQGTEVDWIYEARWVEDRNRMTSSGVSAGMDMALALIEKIYGPQMADAAAEYTEYTRSKDSSSDPFAVEREKK